MFFTKINLMILSLGLVLAMFMPGYAKAESAYSVFEKQEALSYISENLQMLDDSSPALQYFLDAQEDILAGEAESSMVRDMAESYRRSERFTEAFAPTHKLFFERAGIWHIMEMSGQLVISHRCYLQNSAQVACN